ncbi:MAG: hypothetical protein QGI83_02930 [Candidatus Latescibacteria bacterium]|jgi:hypothetical protein|nr:hypothetical protein [Candidatus Latescibacterota bacterium]
MQNPSQPEAETVGAPARTRAKGGRRRKPWPERFIENLRRAGNVKAACTAARVGRATVYRHRATVESFAEAWDDALEEACDVMEQEAYRRAVKGVRRPVYQQAQLVGYVREYSDGLLQFLLKAHRPERFSERTRHEHSGPGGGAIRMTFVDWLKSEEGRDGDSETE